MTQEQTILLRLHFQEMALRFLDGTNPQPSRAIVIADAICSYDGEIDTTRPVRYEAHEFFHEALAVIQNSQLTPSKKRFNDWLHRWNKEFGAG
jgi:hypothetical protein